METNTTMNKNLVINEQDEFFVHNVNSDTPSTEYSSRTISKKNSVTSFISNLKSHSNIIENEELSSNVFESDSPSHKEVNDNDTENNNLYELSQQNLDLNLAFIQQFDNANVAIQKQLSNNSMRSINNNHTTRTDSISSISSASCLNEPLKNMPNSIGEQIHSLENTVSLNSGTSLTQPMENKLRSILTATQSSNKSLNLNENQESAALQIERTDYSDKIEFNKGILNENDNLRKKSSDMYFDIQPLTDSYENFQSRNSSLSKNNNENSTCNDSNSKGFTEAMDEKENENFEINFVTEDYKRKEVASGNNSMEDFDFKSKEEPIGFDDFDFVIRQSQTDLDLTNYAEHDDNLKESAHSTECNSLESENKLGCQTENSFLKYQNELNSESPENSNNFEAGNQFIEIDKNILYSLESNTGITAQSSLYKEPSDILPSKKNSICNLAEKKLKTTVDLKSHDKICPRSLGSVQILDETNLNETNLVDNTGKVVAETLNLETQDGKTPEQSNSSETEDIYTYTFDGSDQVELEQESEHLLDEQKLFFSEVEEECSFKVESKEKKQTFTSKEESEALSVVSTDTEGEEFLDNDLLVENSSDEDILNLSSPSEQLHKINKRYLKRFLNFKKFGINFSDRGSFEENLKKIVKALSLIRLEYGLISFENFEMLVLLGKFYLKFKYFEQAFLHSQHARNLLEMLKSENPQKFYCFKVEKICFVYLNLTYCAIHNNRLDEAQDWVKRAEATLNRSNRRNEHCYIEISKTKAILEGYNGDFSKAIEELTQITEVSTRALHKMSNEEMMLKIDDMQKIAELLEKNQQYSEALDQYNKIYKLYQNITAGEKFLGEFTMKIVNMLLKASVFENEFYDFLLKYALVAVDHLTNHIKTCSKVLQVDVDLLNAANMLLWKSYLTVNNFEGAMSVIKPCLKKVAKNSKQQVDLLLKKAWTYAYFSETKKALILIYELCNNKTTLDFIENSTILQQKLGKTLKEAIEKDGQTNINSNGCNGVREGENFFTVKKTTTANFLSAHQDFRETFNKLLSLNVDIDATRSIGGVLKKSGSVNRISLKSEQKDTRPVWRI
ncbi:hypothetical protein HDU92_007320 [Lobulomyces angularis]|nr:hypothetical protein HDU92_007320 [Lobulomyces angularis]